MSLRDQFAEDVKTVCMTTDDFAIEGIYKVSGETATKKVNGIFKENFKDAAPYRQATDIGEMVFICALVDIPTPKTGDELKVSGTTRYIIKADQNSLSGKMVLYLSDNNPK